MEKHYKKLSVDFPAKEYLYLKLACAKQGISIKDFVTQSIMKSIQQYEDELDCRLLKETLEKENIADAVPWEKAKKELGWDKL